MNTTRAAFVFAGGGNLGAVQVGMLHALAEQNVRPDFVVGGGASAGAINAAYFARILELHGGSIVAYSA